jgi:hypothetical protein
LSLLGGKFEFTPFKVALRETVQWLVDHYDTDARIGRRTHGNSGLHDSEANGKGTAAPVEKEEASKAE